MTNQIAVLSDIHGCASELKLLLNKLPLTPDTQIVFLGDYIDRGHQSKQVIETILELRQRYDVITLKGNHEQLLLDFFDDPSSEEGASFLVNGGSATLASYADKQGRYAIPDEHFDFFESLKLCHQTKDHFFAHAGVPNVKIEEIDEKKHEMDMLWIRDPFHKSSYDWEKVIVHGHTPVDNVEDTPKRINIDTGLVYNGYLTALLLPEKKTYHVARQSITRHVYLKDKDKARNAMRFKAIIPVYIYKPEEILQFETIDINEFGMYIHDIVNNSKQIIDENSEISGAIGNDDHATVPFEGRALRCDKKKEGIFYAVKFTKTPYDFLSEQETKSMSGHFG